MVIWITGRSGAGKTDLAQRFMDRLRKDGKKPYLVDGDVLRATVSKNLGFGPEDRLENCRRAGEKANRISQRGMVAVCALMSPTRDMRAAALAEIEDPVTIVIWKDAPLEILRGIDGKGLYRKESEGTLENVSVDIEPPEDPYFRIKWYNGDGWENIMDRQVENILTAGYLKEG
jgi:adenylylsulfate kinase-like enzyme